MFVSQVTSIRLPAKLPFGYDEDCEEARAFKRRLHDTILDLVIEGYRRFISGGAQGMDMMAAEVVIELRRAYPDITLEMAIPYMGQAERWPVALQERWKKCMDAADMLTVLENQYTSSCFFARNRYMVQQADVLLACYDGKEGGTKMNVDYAKANGCPVCLLSPNRKIA